MIPAAIFGVGIPGLGHATVILVPFHTFVRVNLTLCFFFHSPKAGCNADVSMLPKCSREKATVRACKATFERVEGN